MKEKINLLGVFAVLLLLDSCYSGNVVTNYDYSYLYDDNQSIINPEFKIFHHSGDSSSLYFEINSKDILYERIQGDSLMLANLKMKYTLYADRDLSIVLDSGSSDMANFGTNGNASMLQNAIQFKTNSRKKTWLSIRFRDENKDFNIVNILEIDKRENFNSQYFLQLNGEQVVMNGRTKKRNMTLIKSSLINVNNFVMEMSQKDFGMTPPPFAQQMSNELDIVADSSYSFTFINNRFSVRNSFSFHRYKPKDEENKRWNYYSYFGENFPSLSELAELIDPVRYISTSREYKNLKASINAKKGLDAFWLNLGKNTDNSTQLLKEYYRRVELANKYFTSYKEGWKTDRGIIYIIYGSPSSIRKNADKEVWIFGEENNVLSVQFRFYQLENVNVENHFELVRNSDYKNNWYRQVDLWRQGKIN